MINIDTAETRGYQVFLELCNYTHHSRSHPESCAPLDLTCPEVSSSFIRLAFGFKMTPVLISHSQSDAFAQSIRLWSLGAPLTTPISSKGTAVTHRAGWPVAGHLRRKIASSRASLSSCTCAEAAVTHLPEPRR